jgi:hypothetical protein
MTPAPLLLPDSGTESPQENKRLLVINDPSVSVKHLIEEAKSSNSTSDNPYVGMCLQRLWVEDDEISQELEKLEWNSMEIVSCQGSRLGNLVETALRQKSIQKFALRKIASRLEDCTRAVRSSGFRFLTEMTLEVALSERSCQYLALALDSTSNASSTCSIRHLKMERCSFLIPAALSAFARGLNHNSTLEALAFTRCKLRDDDLQVLIPNLPSSLQSLDLTDNYCRTQLLPFITAANPNIQSLNLTNQHPGEFGGSLDLSQLRQDMSVNTTLNHLDLSFNMLSLNDIRGLIDALGTNASLRTLNLKSNQLNDMALEYIGERLPLMKGLRYLNVTANRFGDHGADAMCEGLKQNYSLTHLQLPRGFAAEEDIHYLLALNQGGRRLLHRNKVRPLVPVGLWPLVLQRINGLETENLSGAMKASVVFFLLQEGPALVGRERSH